MDIESWWTIPTPRPKPEMKRFLSLLLLLPLLSRGEPVIRVSVPADGVHAPRDLGGRLLVSVLATGPDGKGRASYAFAVGRNNVVTRSNVFDLPAVEKEAAQPATTEAAPADAGADLFAEPADSTGFEDAATPATDNTAPAQQDNSLDDFLV